jgi:ABC-type uncharacterized transport system involved in gliding motility auxiliary subunit
LSQAGGGEEMGFLKKWAGTAGIFVMFIGFLTFLLLREYPYLWLPLIAIGCLFLLLYLYFNKEELSSSVKRKAFLYGSSAFFTIVFFLLILVLLNILLNSRYTWIDLTEEKIFSLSPKTRKVLKEIDKGKDKITVYGFFKEGSPDWVAIKELLEKYRYETKKFEYKLIDPEKSPGMAQQYDIRSFGTIVAVYKDRKNKTTEATEEGITNAIVKITRGSKKTVCFVTGHGEKSISEFGENGYSRAKTAIESQGMEVKEITIFEKGEELDKECSTVVIAGPKKKFLPEELSSLKKYLLEKNGALMLMIDPLTETGLESFAEEFGIKVDTKGLVIDPLSRLFGGHFTMPVITKYESHEITKDFNYAAILPIASALSKGNPPEGVDVSTIASSSPNSWFEKDVQKQELKFDEGRDIHGPITLMMAAEKKEAQRENVPSEEEKPKKKMRLVVVGDSDFPSNSFFEFSGNGDLFLNALNWLSQEEDIIAIGPKKREARELNMSASAGKVLFYITSLFLPVIIFVAGISVWLSRKNL